jgi:hypothetical protein
MMGMFMWIAHDAQRRWGNPTQYRDQLAAMRKQTWFERQQQMQEYEEFLEQRRHQDKQDESSR